MTTIERIAYPRRKRNLTVQELVTLYPPAETELAWVRATARDAARRRPAWSGGSGNRSTSG